MEKNVEEPIDYFDDQRELNRAPAQAQSNVVAMK
jgi:hypothetical protein